MKRLNIKYYIYIICSLLVISCMKGNNFDYGKEVLLITGTEVNPMVRFVVEDTPSTYSITASASGKVEQDITVSFALDAEKLAEYNETHKTNFHAVPEGAVVLEGNEGVIKSGSASSTGINVKVVSTDEFVDGRTYVIPVTITNVKGGSLDVLESSRTIFLRIARVTSFNSLDMNNTNLYSNFIFDDSKAVTLDKFTYEVKTYINAWHTTPEQISRLISFTSKDESRSSMLRFGENGQDINSLQWVSPAGGLVSKTRFNPGQWYTISLTFDGSKFIMYVNGVYDSEIAGSGSVTFQRLELGMSWESYPSKQYFNGRLAEVRVWNRALSSGEIQNNICAVDPQAENLVAYWKFNEGTGHIFHDATGNGYDIDWSKTVRDNTGNGTLNPFDKKSYVRWILDDKNKCSQ